MSGTIRVWIEIAIRVERMGWETGIEPATAGATVRCSAS